MILIPPVGGGNLDVYLGNWPNHPGEDEPNLLLVNRGTDHHWLGVRLTGAGGGFGARVTVTTEAGSQLREVVSQTGFRGQSDPSPHFGLGRAATAARVEVRWPSGKVSVLENVPADQRVEVVEPQATP